MKFLRNSFARLAISLILAMVVFAGGSSSFAAGKAAQADVPAAPDKPLAKNVIVMISDGCGYNQIKATDYYQYGREGAQVYEKFPFRFAMSTYSIGGSYNPLLAWSDFSYVKANPTDSAAAATAMSTGVKTYNAALGVDNDQNPVKHVAERAEELGKSTGVVTTVQWSHATPAGFVVHKPSRKDYESIAKEMVYDSKTDVVMGTGNPWFDNDGNPKTIPNTYKYVGGQATWDQLVAGTAGGDADGDGIADPWTLIQKRSDFKSLEDSATPPKRVLGTAEVYATTQQSRSGDGNAAAFAVPLDQNVPTLAEMTRGALNVLDNNQKGFFLMVEGGAVDWASHANQSGRMIEEEVDFNKAVEAVNNWVKKNSNWGETLLIVTGDHETGYLTGPGSDPSWQPLVNNGDENMPGMEWHSNGHTNSLIPLFAKGDAARLFIGYADLLDPIRGPYVDNTNIADVVFRTMN